MACFSEQAQTLFKDWKQDQLLADLERTTLNLLSGEFRLLLRRSKFSDPKEANHSDEQYCSQCPSRSIPEPSARLLMVITVFAAVAVMSFAILAASGPDSVVHQVPTHSHSKGLPAHVGSRVFTVCKSERIFFDSFGA